MLPLGFMTGPGEDVLSRDGFRCKACGADAGADAGADPLVRLDVDHIDPVSNGGKTVPMNLRTLCSRCNNGKGDLVTTG